jgi:hypothetical protein
VAVIAIGLALTLLVAMFVLPWAWKQVSEWLPMAETRSAEPVSALLPLEFVPLLARAPSLPRTGAVTLARAAAMPGAI